MVKGKLSMNDVIAEALENIQSAENQWHRTYCFRRSKETLTKSFWLFADSNEGGLRWNPQAL
jgi:hypothetical protein